MSRRGGYSVGRMHQMIGPGRLAIFLIGRTETYEPNGWAAPPGRALSKVGANLAGPRACGRGSRPGSGNPVPLGLKPQRAGRVRVPAGYLPMTHAEWERWRYPDRFDAALLRRRERDGIRTNGVALVAALVDGVVRAGAEIRADARLTGVTLGPDGSVTAAAVGGETISVTAVILATGGFDWDENLRRAWHPAAQRASGAAPGNTGDGLRIACRAGAATGNLDQGWWMPMLAVPGEEADGRVLAASGTPVPGLYAAGNVAAFWTGDAYPAPGATLGIAMTFGYLAGRHAAARSQIVAHS